MIGIIFYLDNHLKLLFPYPNHCNVDGYIIMKNVEYKLQNTDVCSAVSIWHQEPIYFLLRLGAGWWCRCMKPPPGVRPRSRPPASGAASAGAASSLGLAPGSSNNLLCCCECCEGRNSVLCTVCCAASPGINTVTPAPCA